MNEKQINTLLEANYFKGVADGMTKAYQIMLGPTAEEETKAREEMKKQWFGEENTAEVENG